MPNAVQTKLKDWERRLRRSFGNDISTPWTRFTSWWHFQLFDHAFLRALWTNFDQVAPGVYRSNHPSPARLRRYKRMGIETVLNLRGRDGDSPWLFEEEACRKLGLELEVAKIYARKPAGRAEMLHLIHLLKTLEKPFVFHCKSGADRAGLAAVMYKIIVEGAPIEEARKHLSIRYIHLKWTKTGIVDHIVDMWEADNKETAIGMEEWFATIYDPELVLESFAERRKS